VRIPVGRPTAISTQTVVGAEKDDGDFGRSTVLFPPHSGSVEL
jgi:hypothetical protein